METKIGTALVNFYRKYKDEPWFVEHLAGLTALPNGGMEEVLVIKISNPLIARVPPEFEGFKVIVAF